MRRSVRRTKFTSPPIDDKKLYRIRVGKEIIPMERWREAILHFLFRIWSDDYRGNESVNIRFGELSLDLIGYPGRYMATGVSPDNTVPPPLDSGYTIEVTVPERVYVNEALIRFAKSDRVGKIRLRFAHGYLILWKRERRGEYGCFAEDIPQFVPLRGPV